MKNLIRHISVVVLILSGLIAKGQHDTTWTKTYGGDRDDHGYDIISTADSGYLIIGSTSSFGFDNSQMYFLKLDSIGDILWSKSHGGSGQEAGYSVIETRDGGYLGVGYTNSWGAGGFDLLLVKLAANGNLEYEKYFGGIDWDFAWDVIETDSNVFVIAGETQSFGNGGKDAWLVRYDANYEIFDWNKTYGGPEDEYYKAITKNTSNDLFAAGGGINPNRTDEDVLITKYDINGDTVWNKYYGDTLTDYANDIVILHGTDVGVTGVISYFENQTYTLVLSLQFDGTTNFLDTWGVNYVNSWGTKALSLDSNRFGVLSNVELGNGVIDFHFGYTYPNLGFYQNGTTIGSTNNEISSGGIIVPDDGYIFTGSTRGANFNYSKIILFKTDFYGKVEHPQTIEKITDTSNITNIIIPQTSNYLVTFQYSNSILINQSKTTTLNFEIYNLAGQIVSIGNLNHSEAKSLDSIGLPSGVYILYYHDISNKSSGSIKIVLQNTK